MNTRFTFKKEERLCSKTILDRLFSEGDTVFSYPLKFIFLPFKTDANNPVQVVFSVPKRSFKQAVKRNLIRRRMREAYRINKHELYGNLLQADSAIALMIIYVDKEVKEYKTIERGMVKGMRKLQKLNNTVSED